MEGQYFSMAALGRGFNLGDFYDYRADRILKDESKFSDISGVTTTVEIDPKLQLELDCESQNKWDEMNLNEHLQSSIMAGLIDKFPGASSYLQDPVYPAKISKTLVCRIKSKKECLDLNSFVNKYSEHFSDVLEKKNPSLLEATHIVLGVAYGAEAYFVISQDVNEGDEDAREEMEKNLSNLMTKLESALEEKQDQADFKEQFDKDEKVRLTQLKCRVYSDLEKKAVRECSFFDAYKNCLKIIANREGFVPVAVVLFPLRQINEEKFKEFQFREITSELTARCCQIWNNLERMIGKAEVIQATMKKSERASFVQFQDVLLQFKNMLKLSLKKSILKARSNMDGDDEEVERVLDIAEEHQLFNADRLQQWFTLKKSELEITGKMAAGMNFLASKVQLEKEMLDSFDKKYTLVLTVPVVDKKSNEIISKMKDFVDSYKKLAPYDDDEEDDDDQPWHMIHGKRMQVLGKIHEFSDYIGKNKEMANQVQFFVMIGDVKSGFNCRYSVYENGSLLKENIDQLPTPPAGLRVHATNVPKKSTISFKLEWDYEELGYPCYFLVEHRAVENSDGWKQQKTSKPGQKELSINCKRGLAMEFRVAAITCIGRSEFSEVVDTETALDGDDDSEFMDCDTDSTCSKLNVAVTHQQQPAVKSKKTENGTTKSTKAVPDVKNTSLSSPANLEVDWVTQTKADLSWSRPPKAAGKTPYRVLFWPSDQDPSLASELDVESGQIGCRLEHLLPETTYSVSIVAVSSDGTSLPSTVSFTTLNEEIRFAETVVKRCKNLGKRNGMDLYAVPLTKSTGSKTARRFVFGKADGMKGGQQKGRMQHRTILVMGATGSGKTTLINGMINYIFNVEWEDTFRFQLIQEETAGQSQANSQTSTITAYDILHMEGFRVPYSLTIVDTPGYGDTKGLDRDQEITEMVRKFFEDKDGIQELDVVGFVAQASLPRLTPTQIYIFDSVLSIFGNDVKENINFLLTFADSQVPPVLSAINAAGLPCPTDDETGHPLHHKFNNSGFFCSSRESGPVSTGDRFNRFFWRMGIDNFQKFFSVLATMKTKSLSLTKQVLDERKKLEATVDGLQPLIKTGLTKMEELRKTKQMITNCQAQIEANENVEFEVEVTMPKKSTSQPASI